MSIIIQKSTAFELIDLATPRELQLRGPAPINFRPVRMSLKYPHKTHHTSCTAHMSNLPITAGKPITVLAKG